MSRGAPGGRGGGGWRGGRGGGGRGGGGRGGMGMGLDIPEGLVITYQEIPLYSAFDLPPFREYIESENEMYAVHSQLIETMKSSPFYLEKVAVKKDIERYSDKYSTTKPVSRQLHRIATDLAFFPEELHSVKDATKKIVAPKLVLKDLDLKRLDHLERVEAAQSKKSGSGDAMGVDEDEVLAEEDEYDEDVEEDDNDYLIDYYEDDLDVLGGDGSDGGDYDY